VNRRTPLLAVLVLLVVAACGSKSAAPQLKIGDCFDVPTGADTADIPTKPCSKPHSGEVFHLFDAQGGGAYPSDDEWAQLIYPVCDPVFKTYTGTAVEDRTDIDYLFLVPTSDRWAAGDRRVTCFIRSLDGTPLHQSYRAAG
jgi:Septum formation